MKTNLNISNQMAKAIKRESGSFNAVRRNILSAATDHIVQNNNLIKFLRRSKKEDSTFTILSIITGYSYKLVKEDNESTISKHYTVSNVLNACEIAINTLSEENVEAVKTEFMEIELLNEVKAVSKAKNDVSKARKKLEDLKKLAAVASADSIKEYYAAEILKAQTSLDNKQALYNLVK